MIDIFLLIHVILHIYKHFKKIIFPSTAYNSLVYFWINTISHYKASLNL